MGIRVASLFHSKAKKWVFGRKNILKRLRQVIPPNQKIIWVHCASLGEFEQGRPVIEQLKKDYPTHAVLLTFFSPSGYEAQKNYSGADWVFYLPMDSASNARDFLEIVQPVLVIFVKYEFWYYYLKKIKYRNIPLILISALFRKDMSFFKWYGGLQCKILSRFNHLFVQNEASLFMLEKIGLSSIASVSGDTRFDRVIEIANTTQALPLIEKFLADSPSLIAGSTWPEDEIVIQKAFTILKTEKPKLIIAPHEINETHIAALKSLFPNSILYSQLNISNTPAAPILIIDNIGMLSKLYKYATITYVGGGMKVKGIHNVLEPAVFGKPVIFGPFYKKYSEAIGLVISGGGLSFIDSENTGKPLAEIVERLMSNKTEYLERSNAAANFVADNTGATQKIIRYIQENRLLTN